MLRITQLKIDSKKVHQAKKKGRESFEKLLLECLARNLGVSKDRIQKLVIVRESLDARKKPQIFYIYTLEFSAASEKQLLAKYKNKNIQLGPGELVEYEFPKPGQVKRRNPIVIVGTGPAGLFCGYFLALHGYRPILLERGKCVEERTGDVELFWEKGVFNPDSNAQFGEGGAGTFSDGKLNTLVKDKEGRSRAVLQVFVDCGAQESILYEAKPHIGTDVLRTVVKNMRERILSAGGEVHFSSQMTDLIVEKNRICGVVVNDERNIPCDALVLATGHSARDTFEMLDRHGLSMEAKSFAVGLRVEHPQKLINLSQYGVEEAGDFGAAAYKVTAKTSSGRGVYSFCMCPGGYVVNASSEVGRLAVNGMSYSKRAGDNANSAIIVAVTPEDFGSDEPLAGIAFQRKLEENAYKLAEGRIPMQTYGDFKAHVCDDTSVSVDRSSDLEHNASYGVSPCHKGLSAWSDVHRIMPKELNEAFVQGMETFGRQIRNFNSPDAILSGVESRTSSPVRIHRDELLEGSVHGIYPCGEGAGYAGGITSAAMDGLRVAEMIARKYDPAGLNEK